MLPIEWNSDWQGGNSDNPRSVFDQHILTVDAGSEPSVTAVDKIDAVVLDMKTDHITA